MEKMMDNLPAVVNQSLAINDLISQAISSNLPIESLERLLAMAERMEAKFAKDEYFKALSMFQRDCPIIKKNKPVADNNGMVRYHYATIDYIISQVKELLFKHGFSYDLDSKTYLSDAHVEAIITAHHVAGHSETKTRLFPIAEANKMQSPAQAVAVAMSYAKRYAFCDIFGIMTGDEDYDGKMPERREVRAISMEQLEIISELLASEYMKGISPVALLKPFKVGTVKELTEPQAHKFIERLEAYIDRKKGEDDIPF